MNQFKNNGKLKLLIIVGTRPEISQITPLLAKVTNIRETSFSIFLICAISLCLYYLGNVINLFDNRLYWSFFFYGIGLIGGGSLYRKFIGNKHLWLVMTILIIPMKPWSIYGVYGDEYCNVNLIFSVPWLIITIKHISRLLPISFCNIIATLSYTSMSLFLFHRPFFRILSTIYRHWLDVNHCNFWYGCFVMVPVSYICCYYIQSKYDSFSAFIDNRK